MRLRWLVLLGALAFALNLALHVPAALLYAWSHPEKSGSPTRLEGVSGSLVHGSFAALTMNGRPVLSDVRWELHPWWLALMRLSAEVEAGGDSVVRMTVSRAVFGALRVTDLSAAGSVKALMGVLGQAGLPIEGQARLEMPLLRFDGGVPVEATGNAELQNLAWTLAREPLPLGTFSAALSTDDKGILVSLTSGPGPLELGGTATLNRERAYDVQLSLRSRPDAPPQLQALVRSLGAADPQGYYHLRRSGKL